MVNYEIVKEAFENENCQLLTTEKEMKEKNLGTTDKYTIIASCGHKIDNCWFHMFKYRGTGKICKDCIDLKQSEHSIALNKNIDGNSYGLLIEAQSFDIIKKYTNLDLKVSPECCTADLAIKDPVCLENKWLPIQVKATLKGRHNIYSFGLRHNYKDMIIIFVCIEEEKFWIINGNMILDQCKFSIGIQKSKYNQYQVDKSELSEKLLEYYKTMDTYTIEHIQTPITKECKKEQVYRKLRETKLNTIPFEYPQVNQCVYDFTVNNYKIQEKVAFLTKNCFYSVLLSKRDGQISYNKAYEQGDNEFYWINLQDNETFYIIPEYILVQRHIISSKTLKGGKYLSFAEQNDWLNEYKYSYNQENINEIITDYFKNFDKNEIIISTPSPKVKEKILVPADGVPKQKVILPKKEFKKISLLSSTREINSYIKKLIKK